MKNDYMKLNISGVFYCTKLGYHQHVLQSDTDISWNGSPSDNMHIPGDPNNVQKEITEHEVQTETNEIHYLSNIENIEDPYSSYDSLLDRNYSPGFSASYDVYNWDINVEARVIADFEVPITDNTYQILVMMSGCLVLILIKSLNLLRIKLHFPKLKQLGYKNH